MHASKHGHAEMVVLSRFNADVDTSGDWVDSDDSDYDSELYYFDPFHGFHGKAALMYAAGAGNVSQTELLINKYNADIHATDNRGSTVLVYAYKRCCRDIIEKASSGKT